MENERLIEAPCFENRELSWLRFNERVLEEAEDVRVPLCERLNFLSIFQSNLDEFFMVRIGSLHDQMLLDNAIRENKTHMTPEEQLDAALMRIRQLCIRRDSCYDALIEKVREQGITKVGFADLNSAAEAQIREYFEMQIQPVLSTFVVNKKQPFPFLKNKEIYAMAVLNTKNEKQKLCFVPCSDKGIQRVVEVPERPGCYMLAEEIILHYLPQLFPEYHIGEKSLVRITRNADIDADAIYDEDLNYRDHMSEVVKRRKRLCPVRMELSREMGTDIVNDVCSQIKLDVSRVFVTRIPLDTSFAGLCTDALRSHPELYYAQRHPQNTPDIKDNAPILDQIEEHDVLLHYPYQSIRPFLRMLEEAAKDPSVVSIKMTLYRLARDSKVVECLVEAAENGKRVDVLVELKARFDEENNIEWSRRLERAGCHVIYGIEHIKVHSKLCIISRIREGRETIITQIGTGNYNEKTSRFYTDLSYMTAREEIGWDAVQVFNALMLGETVDHVSTLMAAPHCLQNKLIDLIDGEISKVRSGKKGHIRLKLNSLSDKVLMTKLIEASQAGVEIDMIIRGINCLRSGIPGWTDHIKIISVVGRFLEHSRIYIFGDGDDAATYISSADWMTRNTLRRVEIAVPILDEGLQNRISGIFNVMMNDNVQARVQRPEGNYIRRNPGSKKACSGQNMLYDEAYRLAASSSMNSSSTAF